MTQVLFLFIGLVALFLFYFAIGKDKKILSLFLIWQIIIGTFTLLKVFEKNPKLFPLAILGTVLLIFFSIKKIDKENLNATVLLTIHILRVPVEFLLLQLFFQNKIPVLMTFKGWNFDILFGISALVILIYQAITRKNIISFAFKLWNIIGILFLANIVLLAILSSPLPIQQFAFEQPNIAVLEFPYYLLPTCIVPIVLISHLLLLKKIN